MIKDSRSNLPDSAPTTTNPSRARTKTRSRTSLRPPSRLGLTPVLVALVPARADDAIVAAADVVLVGRLDDVGVVAVAAAAARVLGAVGDGVRGVGDLLPDADGVAGGAVAGVRVTCVVGDGMSEWVVEARVAVDCARAAERAMGTCERGTDDTEAAIENVPVVQDSSTPNPPLIQSPPVTLASMVYDFEFSWSAAHSASWAQVMGCLPEGRR